MAQAKSREFHLKIDTSLYPVEAIQAAAYAMTDRAYARLARSGKGSAEVRLKPKPGAEGSIDDEFYNELLHQALRLKVSENNQKIREYIVTKALVSAQVPAEFPMDAPAQSGEAGAPAPAGGDAEPCPECAAQEAAPPVDAELEKEIEKLLAEIEKSGPASEDPLGVAVPWEEKHGAKGGAAKGAGKPKPAKPSRGKASAAGKGGRKAA